MAGGSSGGHGFGVPKEINGKNNKSKKRYEPERKMEIMHRSGSNAALANDLRELGRNELHSRQRISYNTNQRQETRKQPMEMRRLHRMDATPNKRMTQTTRDNRTVLENVFRKQRRNKT